ncbi:hypothetical protein OB13_08670 [Pontibacter sp. HJ8]
MVQMAFMPDDRYVHIPSRLALPNLSAIFFTARYREGDFTNEQGFWNRSELLGYTIVCVPCRGGKPARPSEYFLTGFDSDRKDVKIYGRPVGGAIACDGSLPVANDAGSTIGQVNVTQITNFYLVK